MRQVDKRWFDSLGGGWCGLSERPRRKVFRHNPSWPPWSLGIRDGHSPEDPRIPRRLGNRSAPPLSLLGALLPVFSSDQTGGHCIAPRPCGAAAWLLPCELGDVSGFQLLASAGLYGAFACCRLPCLSAVESAL